MSAQRTEKSLDSHHLVVDKRETPRADDFHVTGNTNVTQPEGDAEPLSVLSRSHNPQPETHLTSASRRKLGSRRRNKQQQHVKDSATDLHHKPREELEENTKGNEALETTQPERQDQLHNQSEHESSVTRDSSLCSPTKSGYSGVVRDSAKNTEDNQEIQILKSGNQQADRDEKQSYGRGLVETTLEVSGAAAILQSEDGKEDIACSSDLISSLSATENEKRREEDTDLLRQDGNVEGNCLKGEADVKTLDAGFSAAPEATTDKNNPTQNTEIADDNQNDQFSLHLDSQTPDVSVSTKERSDANFSRSVNRGKMGSSRRNKRPQHVKDSVPESEKEPVENVGFGAFEPETFSALTETDVQVKSEETVLGGANMPDTDGTERKEFGHVADMSESNTSSFLPTPSVSEPLINQSNDREMPFDLPSVFSATNAERKERDEDTDLLEQWTSLHSTDLVNESHVKSDYLECPMKVEASTEDHGEHREPECCVESAIDSSPNEQLSTNEEPNKHFSLTEVRAARNLHEEEFKPAEMQEMHLIDHSFVGANSEICFSNPTDQAEVGDSSQSDSSVKGVAEQGVSKPDYKQDTHPAKPSDVKAFTQMKEDCQVYAARKPEAGDIERVDTAVVQVYENEGQLEDDIKPSTEQTSHQEKEGVPSEATGSKSPPGTLESETQPQGASGITDQSNTDFHPFSNRRKLGSSRRNNRHNKVETPGVESEMSLMQDTEVQGISMQLMLEGRDKVGPSQTEEVCDDNKENAHSSNFGLTSIHSSSPVEQQVTEQPNSPVSAYSAVTETESKEKEGDTDLLTRWGILQADDTVNETHTQSESVESSSKPEKSSYREHTESKCGVEQMAVPSPKEEMSTMEGQNEHFSSFEVRGAQQSEEAMEEEEVKPIHTQTTHQIDNSSVEEGKPCVQTLESETNSPLDSQPVDDSVSIKEETHSDFKLTGSRRKLGSSRRMKRRQHGPEVTEPEEEAGENAEKEKIATGTKSQEELKEQTSPDFKLTVELSGSQLKTLAQQTLEENPDSPTQSETEHRLTPDYLPAKLPPPQKHDVASESSASGGRRRKMGSSRKSHGHEKYEDTTANAQKETDAKGLTDESVSRTSQRPTEEPLGSAEKPEVDEIVRKSSPNINDSDAPQPSRPLSGKAPGRGTPVQHHNAEIHLRQESHTKFSLAEDSRGADIRSKGYHVILVGDSNVGKSSLIKRAHSGKFSLDIPASVGLDSCMWTVVVDGNPVVLQLWDTAGQERFRSVTRQVFHKAQAFLLMYDITSYESFSGVSYWANCIQEGAAEDVIILLLGNKSDCGERQVNTEEADILAKEYNFEFMECSAATGDNVTHSLETVARMLLEKVATSEEAVALHRAPLKKERSGCC